MREKPTATKRQLRGKSLSAAAAGLSAASVSGKKWEKSMHNSVTNDGREVGLAAVVTLYEQWVHEG